MGGLLWSQVFDPLFGVPVLVVAGLWILSRSWRLAERDLIPLSFLLAGVLHTGLFKVTAIVHIYWAWPLNVFFAVAVADFLMVFGARWVRGRLLPYVRGAVALVFAAFFLAQTVPLVDELRRKGGSLHKQHYRSNYLDWAFAQQVREWSPVDATLHLAHGLNTRPEIVATLRRPVVKERYPRRAASLSPGVHLLGDVRRVPVALLEAAAARGRVDVVHPYFYARPSGPRGTVTHRFEPLEPSWLWWLLSSPFESPVRVVATVPEGSAPGSADSPH
jgi:hypothetical protein